MIKLDVDKWQNSYAKGQLDLIRDIETYLENISDDERGQKKALMLFLDNKKKLYSQPSTWW